MNETRLDLEPPTEVMPRGGRVDHLHRPEALQSFALSGSVPRRRSGTWRDRCYAALLVFLLLLIANVTVFDVLVFTHLGAFK